MSSLLVFTPDLTQPSLTNSAEISQTQMDAARAFIAAQNADQPGKYENELSLFVSNQRGGLLASLVTAYPPTDPVTPMSGITFVPDASSPDDEQQWDFFTSAEMRALATFTDRQNTGDPGKYAGPFDVMMSNWHDALLTSILGLYPPTTVSSSITAVENAIASRDAALAAANPLPDVGPDPVTIPPYSA